MIVSKAIGTYTVMYSTNRFSPRIGLQFADGTRGQLVFWPAGMTLPADFIRPSGEVDVQYTLPHFANVIDLLRNERPLSLVYENDPAKISATENGLWSGLEPVGEEESDGDPSQGGNIAPPPSGRPPHAPEPGNGPGPGRIRIPGKH